ncbi:hypothetical protein GJ496_003126 [Pomphorhynchus laevis]|nr:hypothetical protein GJ496_003126 [Pomphorhynchus laevis]
MRNPADDVEGHFHRSVAVVNNNILNSDIETSERTLSEMMKRFREEIDKRSRKSMEQVSQAAHEKWKFILQHASWPGASAWLTATPTRLHRSHLNQKQFQVAMATRYNLVKRINRIEDDVFIPAVVSSVGGHGIELQRLLKKAAGRLAEESGQPYGLIITQLSRRLAFWLIKAISFEVHWISVLGSMKR